MSKYSHIISVIEAAIFVWLAPFVNLSLFLNFNREACIMPRDLVKFILDMNFRVMWHRFPTLIRLDLATSWKKFHILDTKFHFQNEVYWIKKVKMSVYLNIWEYYLQF